MQPKELEAAIEGILFAAGEPVPAARIALVLGVEPQDVFGAAEHIAAVLEREGRGIRLLRLDQSLQLCSAPELGDLIARAIEQRRTPKLSQASLEALAVVAYFQPVTRAYIEQVRGVDSTYTVGVLAERGLIESCGRLDVPGRPTVYKTGENFLRVMGISSLDELPALPDFSSDDGIRLLKERIDTLSAKEEPEAVQMEIKETV
ncbi:MAG: SMC-Scp complex subunit ScpB [Firmicutes bacterium]|nr:SMC-Scp complex subunit ScpB [Bacillota bacterium]